MNNLIFSSSYIGRNDDVHFVLDQHTLLNCYSTSSQKQQSFTGRHVAPLGHIILIPSQQVSDHTAYWNNVETGVNCHKQNKTLLLCT